MTDSHTVGLQSSTIALMRVPLKRLVVPAVAIFTSGSIAGCFAYFVVAPPSVSPTEASATWGQWRETDRPAVLDRPSNEDIVKAFRLATEGHGPVVAQDAVFNSPLSAANWGAYPITKEASLATPLALSKRTTPLEREYDCSAAWHARNSAIREFLLSAKQLVSLLLWWLSMGHRGVDGGKGLRKNSSASFIRFSRQAA